MTPKQGPPARSPSSLAKLSPQLASAVNAEKLASAATPPSGMPPGMEGRSPSLKKMGSSGTKKAQTAALEEAEVAVAAGVAADMAASAWAAEAPAAVGPADTAPKVVSPEEQLKSSVSSLEGGVMNGVKGNLEVEAAVQDLLDDVFALALAKASDEAATAASTEMVSRIFDRVRLEASAGPPPRKQALEAVGQVFQPVGQALSGLGKQTSSFFEGIGGLVGSLFGGKKQVRPKINQDRMVITPSLGGNKDAIMFALAF